MERAGQKGKKLRVVLSVVHAPHLIQDFVPAFYLLDTHGSKL